MGWRARPADGRLLGSFIQGGIMQRAFRSWLRATLLAALLLAPGWAGANDFQRPFDRIVVFGTSLSDPGNLYQLNGGMNIDQPDFGMTGLDLLTRIPSAPYAVGANHFSNGSTWVEQLARPLGLDSSVRPAMAGSDGVASNYAIAGARAYVTSEDHPLVQAISLGAQVDNFLADVRFKVPSSALYVVEMGGNDLRAVLDDPARAAEIIGGAVLSVGQTIGKLHHLGARRFLVWNAPDLGLTPALRTLDGLAGDTTASEGATAAAMGFNVGLHKVLDNVARLPGIEIVRFDAFGEVRDIVRHHR